MERSKLHRNVVALGLVSLFTDFSSEMIYPLLPVFLTVTLAASPAVLGLVEGVAETTASLLKLFSGAWSDRTGRKKPLVLAGYGLSTLPASVLFGLLWNAYGAPAAFGVSAGLALLAAALLLLLRPEKYERIR